MAQSFIGKPISLISHSDVRYRGILAGINAQASTIQLSNVYSMGTETRRPPAQFIPPVQEPYEYIIFRASEVKDLAVDEPVPQRSVHDDPAVIGASQQAPAPSTYPPAPQPAYQQPQSQPAPAPAPAPRQQQQGNRRSNNVHTAAASLETVERAIGDLRVSQAQQAGARGGQKTQQIKVPTTDFDFESSNARFDKAALSGGGGGDDASDNEEDKEKKEKEKEKKAAYNPQKSFFDELTPGNAPAPRGGRGGGRGRGGRNRREEERERNVATFGEPGGVGLMGPGAYVGGWGGYGRRGGRPRRGAPAGARS